MALLEEAWVAQMGPQPYILYSGLKAHLLSGYLGSQALQGL